MTVEKRKEYFRMVRDIPYTISEGFDYSCSTKDRILEVLLDSLDLETRKIIAEFRWESLDLPEDVLEKEHEDPTYHQYLEVYIPETKEWVDVGPTWDSGLEDTFEVAEWDGKTSTEIAVPAKKIYSPEESRQILNKLSSEDSPNYTKFYSALNEYLWRQRGLL